MARPSDYSPEIAVTICDRIAQGESLRGICSAEAMPDKATVLRWVSLHPEFRDQYARAREAQADTIFDQILEIADDTSGDFKEKQLGEDGPMVEIIDHEHISRSKLRVDARKWVAGKLAPKRYGERVALTGADGGAIATRDETPSATPAEVLNELSGIFGAALAAVGAAPAKPAPGDPVLHKGANRRGRKKPRAPAKGKAPPRKK